MLATAANGCRPIGWAACRGCHSGPPLLRQALRRVVAGAFNDESACAEAPGEPVNRRRDQIAFFIERLIRRQERDPILADHDLTRRLLPASALAGFECDGRLSSDRSDL